MDAHPSKVKSGTGKKGKIRLDLALVERGLVESREKAQRLIMAGRFVSTMTLQRRLAKLFKNKIAFPFSKKKNL
jgi:predicted rRNA methylase YqxC with S4 and FtsJ domains